jgi:hypothetical protein
MRMRSRTDAGAVGGTFAWPDAGGAYARAGALSDAGAPFPGAELGGVTIRGSRSSVIRRTGGGISGSINASTQTD